MRSDREEFGCQDSGTGQSRGLGQLTQRELGLVAGIVADRRSSMGLMNPALEEHAEALWCAEQKCAPIAPLTETAPDLSVDDAYRIQLLNVQRRLDAGGSIRGHKVGLTARPMQEMLGVDEPDYGHLFPDMFVSDGGAVDVKALCFPRVEPEVAFVLKGPLAGPSVTAADVVQATDFVLPALELIDSRIDGWRIKLVDTVADNASSARVMLGSSPTLLQDVDLRTVGCVLRRNGEIVETGTASAVLGNPVTAVVWLANKLAVYGTRVEAGHVVLPGSCTKAVDLQAGDHIRADFDVLGGVAMSMT